MPRATLPVAIALLGILVAGLLAMTRFSTLLEGGARADADLYNLIADALNEPRLPHQPELGQSPLPVRPAPSPTPREGHQPVTRSPQAASAQPAVWAAAAATADSGGLRDWLSPWVFATSVTQADTVRLTLRRWSWRRGCPFLSTLTALSAGAARRDYRLVHIAATCPTIGAARSQAQ